MNCRSSVLHLGKSGIPSKAITNDDADRLLLCLRVLSDANREIETIFSEKCRKALSVMLVANALQESSLQKVKIYKKKKEKNFFTSRFSNSTKFRIQGEGKISESE